MAQHYIDVTEEQLMKLRDAMELLERLDREKTANLDLFLYGMTTKPAILDSAREVIAEELADEDVTEEDVNLSEIAVALPVYADNIYHLTGSGIRLDDREAIFAYVGETEGVRTHMFGFAHYKPQVNLADFNHISLADSDLYVDEFFRQHATTGAAQVQHQVRRTEEATQPGVPTTETETPAPPPAQPKRTSADLGALVERFLG